MSLQEVAVRMVDPRPAGAVSEGGRDAAWNERQRADLARIDAWNKDRRDKIGEFLKAGAVRFNETWAHLRDRSGRTITVSKFYPALNVAVDVFPSIGSTEEIEIADKRRIFAKVGVRYGALDYSMELAELIPQVGL